MAGEAFEELILELAPTVKALKRRGSTLAERRRADLLAGNVSRSKKK